jgi:hypothetical protein
LSAGNHTLQAKAYDTAGNVSVSEFVIVTVSAATTTTMTLNPTADSYARDGSYAITNYGTSQSLYARTTTSTGYNRDVYMKFSLSSVSTVKLAKLRIYAASGTAAAVTVTAFGVADTSWTENGITCNNKPVRGLSFGSTVVSGTTPTWYELDLTSYVQSAKAAGKNVISIALHSPSEASTYIKMNSKESPTSRSQLVIQGF